MHTNIGILGGTFNPIHFGHLRMAEELAEYLRLDQIRFIPSANPPHKSDPKVSADDRANMVQLAIEDNPRFSVDRLELARTGASYTIDTLLSLRDDLEELTALNLIMGTDAFMHFDTWHRWEDIIQHCHIVLVQRPQQGLTDLPKLSQPLEAFLSAHYTEDPTDLHQAPSGHIHMQTITPLTISSTDIRARYNQQQSIRYLCPKKVVDYIAENHFYSEMN